MTKVTASAPLEVERVVELVLDHARTRPDESVGVIALASPHANEITEALRRARNEHPELSILFDEDRAEPLFVKNLERVQGDERDHIILTTGYSGTTDGRMRYAFGPLNQQGGERRLNVAMTRARSEMLVFSTLDPDRIDLSRTQAQGVADLKHFLEYAHRGLPDCRRVPIRIECHLGANRVPGVVRLEQDGRSPHP